MILRKLIIYIALVTFVCSCGGKGKGVSIDTTDSTQMNMAIDSIATEIMAETIDFVEVPQSVEDSVMALLDEYYKITTVDSLFTPETEMEKTLYAMKDSITYEDYFWARFDPHFNYEKRVFTIPLNDPLPENFYIPIFAHNLLGWNSATSQSISGYVGDLLRQQPQRINEMIALASEMGDVCKYMLLTDIISRYLWESFIEDPSKAADILIPEIPLYKYIKDDVMLNAYFINEFKKYQNGYYN